MRLQNIRASLIGLIVLILGWGVPVSGQTFQGTLTGTVVDPTGAVIRGAEVTAVEQDRAYTRSVTTQDDGTYTLVMLPPGLYLVTVKSAGFKTAARGPIDLTVNQHLAVDFKMEIGVETSTVNVTATAATVDTLTSSLGTTIRQTQVDEVPVNGRQFLELTLLVPGVVPGTPGSRIGDRGGAINVDGLRDSTNSYWMDGLDDTAVGVGQFTVAPPLDSVKEMRMETGVYDAKFGVHAGAQVNIVTKSGTNKLHGSAYDFLENTHLNARNFFDPERPTAHRNQFGATLGGPVEIPGVYHGRDRTFYFLAYEGTRDLRSIFNHAIVPTLAERGGDFSDLLAPDCPAQTMLLDPLALFQGNIQPFRNIDQVLPRADPLGQAIVNLLPPPNVSGVPCGDPNYTTLLKRKIFSDAYFARVDHQWTSKNTVTFRYNLNKANQFFPSDTSSRSTNTHLPGFGTFSHDMFQMAGLDWTHLLSPTFLNEFKFGFNRWQIRDDNQDEGNPIAQQLNIMGVPAPGSKLGGYPQLNFVGYDALGSDNTDPQTVAVNTYQLADTVTQVEGNHTITYGIDFRSVLRGNSHIATLTRGQFDFTGGLTGLSNLPPQQAQQVEQLLNCLPPACTFGNSIAETLLGLPTDWFTGFQQSVSGHLAEYDFFGQDSWKVRPNLTLHLGLRYEYKGLATEKYDRFANFDFATGQIMVAGRNNVTLQTFDPMTFQWQPTGQTSLGSTGANRSLQHPDKDDFAPRFGFAWQPPTGMGTLVRGGYGIYYNQTFGDVFFLKAANPPFVSLNAGNIGAALPYIQSGTFPLGTGALISQALAGVVGPFFPTLSPFQLNFQDAMIHEWNLNVMQPLSYTWVMELGYVGTRGLRLPFETDPNQPAPDPVTQTATPRYPALSGFSYTQSNGRSAYHALQVKMERHSSKGLTFLGAYTYSKSLDTNSSEFTTSRDQNFPQNSRNLAAEKGRSDFDFRHRLTLAYVYHLPGGGNGRALNNANLNRVAGGWELAGVFTAQSGPPFTPQVSGNLSHADEQAVIGTGFPTDRPNLTGSAVYPANKTPDQYLLRSGFGFPDPYTFGNAGRNILTGPGLSSWDFSLIRNFRFTESTGIEFRGEIFNFLNHPNFDIPQRDYASLRTFGQILSTLPPIAGLASGGPGSPRQVQLALRLSW